MNSKQWDEVRHRVNLAIKCVELTILVLVIIVLPMAFVLISIENIDTGLLIFRLVVDMITTTSNCIFMAIILAGIYHVWRLRDE